MYKMVGKNNGIAYVMMHMKGTPETMQSLTQYDDLMIDTLSYFSKRIRMAEQNGIKDIIIDPGFGFAKTLDQNYEILKKLNHFGILEKPILAGLSRKSMLYNLIGVNSEEALNATTAANMICLMNGASLLRVHDVKPAVEAIKIYEKTFL